MDFSSSICTYSRKQCKVVVLSRYNHVGMKKPLNSIKYLLAWPTQSSNYLCVTHTFTLSILFCKQAKCSFRLSNFGKIWFKFWLIKLPKCDHCDPKKSQLHKIQACMIGKWTKFSGQKCPTNWLRVPDGYVGSKSIPKPSVVCTTCWPSHFLPPGPYVCCVSLGSNS